MRKFDKRGTKKGSGPYVPKIMRTHLGDLSLRCFGTRSRWRKLSALHNIEIDSMLEQMEAIIKYRNVQLKKIEDAKTPWGRAKNFVKRKSKQFMNKLKGVKDVRASRKSVKV